MGYKKKKKARTHLQSQAPSIGLKPSELAAPASSGPAVTTKYLLAIWRTHPLRPRTILVAFIVVFAIAFVLTLAATKGLLPQFIIKLAGENMMPRTAIIIGAVCLWVLSGVIAFRGPFQTRTGWIYETFGVALPTVALTSWGGLCGISMGVLGAALIVGAPMAPLLREVGLRLGLFAFGLMIFLSITVTTADAPGYASQRFRSVTRRFAAVLFLLMTGWFIVGYLYAAEQEGNVVSAAALTRLPVPEGLSEFL
jgi:hypothetical protein